MNQNEQVSVKNGEIPAYAELLKQFEPLIKSEVSECIRKLPAGSEFDEDELKSEAMLALYKASVSYVSGKNVTFGLYAKICIHNKMISCARKISSRYRKRMRDEMRRAYNSGSTESAEERLISQLQSEKVQTLLKSESSELERKIFSLYLQKKSYAEISEKIGKDIRSVGNAIYRVKRKLRKHLSNRGE